MRIFLICPVRGATPDELSMMEKYVQGLESSGHVVHWPPRDTDQRDPIGLRICGDNRQAIVDANEVHVWWSPTSMGSLFDLGMAFALEKKIVLANFDRVERTPNKSFSNVLLELAK